MQVHEAKPRHAAPPRHATARKSRHARGKRGWAGYKSGLSSIAPRASQGSRPSSSSSAPTTRKPVGRVRVRGCAGTAEAALLLPCDSTTAGKTCVGLATGRPGPRMRFGCGAMHVLDCIRLYSKDNVVLRCDAEQRSVGQLVR